MSIFIKKTVREDSSNDLDDILTIKYALKNTGHYKTPDYGITPYPNRELFSAIRSYQKDNDLKVDGVMHPRGETIAHLNKKPNPEPGVKSPRFRCIVCGGFHGGVFGDICQHCILK